MDEKHNVSKNDSPKDCTRFAHKIECSYCFLTAQNKNQKPCKYRIGVIIFFTLAHFVGKNNLIITF